MKGIIWYKNDREKAYEQLEKIAENYKRMNISNTRIIRSNFDSFAEFENGDNWKIVKVSEAGRGNCCNVSYVERNIDYELYRNIISPCTKSLPYTAIHFWGEGDLHISAEPPLPF